MTTQEDMISEADLAYALARLPRPSAPAALREKLERRWLQEERRAPRGNVIALASVLAVAAAVLFFFARGRDANDVMVTEAINDHLRVLYAEHPVEIASGGIHQVKPWFTGRLDFAPVVAFAGDDEFPLEGGSVAWYVDRKAAAFHFKRRLHTITLLVFRAEGLPWSPAGGVAQTAHGLHVRLWRDGDLGYALVSDVTDEDLRLLEARVRGK
jgi:anti-sigma factor RsiW